MVEGDQVQGGQQGGGRTFSEEDVMALMNEAARRAAAEAIKNQPRNDDVEEDTGSVINPKVVRQLKDTVAVFTALKDLSSNPLQRTIEETVGGMAASVVQSAFSPRGPPPKKDIVETILNSQFAFGLGSGLGQRGPELVETMGRTFGTDKAGQMIENVIGKYGSGGGGGNSQGGQSRQLGPPSSSPSVQSEQKSDKQSEKELLLSLDPNNPEHVSAYAETQGGLPVEVARKMLMIHQDAFIEQLKKEGMNIDQISTQRGSRIDTSQHTRQPSNSEQGPSVQQGHPSTSDRSNPSVQPEMPYNYEEQGMPNSEDMQYADYQDLSRVEKPQGQNPQSIPSNNKNDEQQTEIMKTFATDIGKVMGEMLNKIESINNTVFTLQAEVNTIKKKGISSKPITENTNENIRRDIPVEEPSLEIFDESDVIESIIDQSSPIIKEQKIRQPKSSKEFFEEDIKNPTEFLKELEEDAKRDIERSKQKTSVLPYAQIPSGQVPPQTVPVAHTVPPATNPISSVIEPQKGQQEQLGNNDIDSDNKGIDNKNSYKLVTPIHKKSNIKPSFKKSEKKEDIETNPNKEV